MTTRRLLRLRPWIVRAMIPDQLIGTYVLFQNGTEHYIGRSDTCLRRRLLTHCTTAHGEYFTYDVHPTPELAFAMECSLFHTYRHGLVNVLHPDRPDYQSPKCPFCWDTLASTLKSRLRTKNLP
ncbi:GIY-YIG nuclease family protein [Streptomyces sp. NPDC015220]|uniref:GIY-YIG nuclease family protein n=1 Tax=Streptomyces sp. NPDC015220 TaxID=3364947 RepID=UPI0036F4E0F9